MFACKLKNGTVLLLHEQHPDTVEAFEFELDELPAPADPEKEYDLVVDFNTRAFKLVVQLPKEPEPEPEANPDVWSEMAAAYKEGVQEA